VNREAADFFEERSAACLLLGVRLGEELATGEAEKSEDSGTDHGEGFGLRGRDSGDTDVVEVVVAEGLLAKEHEEQGIGGSNDVEGVADDGSIGEVLEVNDLGRTEEELKLVGCHRRGVVDIRRVIEGDVVNLSADDIESLLEVVFLKSNSFDAVRTLAVGGGVEVGAVLPNLPGEGNRGGGRIVGGPVGEVAGLKVAVLDEFVGVSGGEGGEEQSRGEDGRKDVSVHANLFGEIGSSGFGARSNQYRSNYFAKVVNFVWRSHAYVNQREETSFDLQKRDEILMSLQ
jgi:hypothetical protein